MSGLKIKLNLGRASSSIAKKDGEENPITLQGERHTAGDNESATAQKPIQSGSLTKLKLKIGASASIPSDVTASVPFSPSGFHASDERMLKQSRLGGKKKSLANNKVGTGKRKHNKKEGDSHVSEAPPQQQNKKIKLSTTQGLSKIKLSLLDVAKKVDIPGLFDRVPGRTRGRGRKPGRGRGRPAKAKVDDVLIEKEWEEEMMMVKRPSMDDDVVEEPRRGGPGRRPKALTGNTPATQEDISILVNKIWDRDYDSLFKHPVTDEEAPGYSEVISSPMDLSTIRSKNEAGHYQTWEQLAADIYLMFNNALKYNEKDSMYWKLSKTQQMHARSLIDNARQGRVTVNAKAMAATAARKETIAAKVHAREKRNAVLKKARAEQKAAQEAKILKRAGVDVDDNESHRSSFRKRTDGIHYHNFQGLAASKTGDGVYIGFFNPSFALGSGEAPKASPYAESLKTFVASLSTAAFEKVKKTMLAMFPKYYKYEEMTESNEGAPSLQGMQ